jgi:hypothetical protein
LGPFNQRLLGYESGARDNINSKDDLDNAFATLLVDLKEDNIGE